MGVVLQLLWGRGGDFQELGYSPLFDFCGQPWNRHGTCDCVFQLANMLQGARIEAQCLVEVGPSTTMDLFGSNQFSLVLKLCHSFKGCALSCFRLFQYHIRSGTILI